jgi:hypothetical protein
MNDPMRPTFSYGDRFSFALEEYLAPCSTPTEPQASSLARRPFGRDAPVAGLIYAEFPVVGTVWVSLGDLEPLESK